MQSCGNIASLGRNHAGKHGQPVTLALMKSKLENMKLQAQTKFALELLGYHGGQSDPIYAVGSCMLSDSNKGQIYLPSAHRGHSDTAEEQGAVSMAIRNLRGLKKDANFPECVTPAMEKRANRIADQLDKIARIAL